MSTTRLRFVSLLMLILCPALVTASTLTPGGTNKYDPRNWTRTSDNGQFIFVMRETNPKVTSAASQDNSDAAKALTYPLSGLYRIQNRELLWSTDVVLEQTSGLRYHHIQVLNDGMYVIWLNHRPIGPPDSGPGSPWWGGGNKRFVVIAGVSSVSDRQSTAVKIMAAGKLVGVYRQDELVHAESVFPQYLPDCCPWIETAEASGTELILETLDDQQLTFNLDTGELTDRRPRPHISWLTIAFLIGLVLSLSLGGFILYRRSSWTSDGDSHLLSNRPEQVPAQGNQGLSRRTS